MHELGMGNTGSNLHFGTPRNPYDPERYPGGSSGGSAAAVAGGFVPIALGCDGGGSIRVPASLTGIYGLKATFGRIPHPPGMCYSVCHIGPMAANLDDILLAYAVMAGPSEEDRFSLAQPPVHVPLKESKKADDLRGIRVGIFNNHFQDSDVDVQKACAAAIHKFAELGAEIVNITIPFLHVIAKAQTVIILSEIRNFMDRHLKEHMYDLSPELRVTLAIARELSARDLLSAQQTRSYATEVVRRLFEGVDVIISPTVPMTAPSIPEDLDAYGESDLTTSTRLMRYAPLANVVGHPAMSIPIGYDAKGLPIGLQLETDFWNEDVMFQLASVIDATIVEAHRIQPQIYVSVLSDSS